MLKIPADSTNAALDETMHALTSLVRSFFISLPDAFVASPLWTSHSKQLEGILLTPDLEPTLAETIKADLADLSARAEASSEGTYDADSVEPDELEMIQVRCNVLYISKCTDQPRQILDDIAFPSDLTFVHKSLFHKRRRRLPIASELSILFTWATSADRSGSHRPYAVAALIAMERDHVASASGSSSSGRSKLDVEAAFIGWIDRGLAPWDSASVAGLLAELVRVGVVSYSLYLQRMIARGETEQGHEVRGLLKFCGDRQRGVLMRVQLLDSVDAPSIAQDGRTLRRSWQPAREAQDRSASRRLRSSRQQAAR